MYVLLVIYIQDTNDRTVSPCLFFLFFLNLFIYLFIFGCVGSSLLCGLSIVGASRGYSSLWCTGFSLQWLLFVVEHRLQAHRPQ